MIYMYCIRSPFHLFDQTVEVGTVWKRLVRVLYYTRPIAHDDFVFCHSEDDVIMHH